MLPLLSFLLTISILVIIHEFGHYLLARWFKVKVLTFAIGFGPSICAWRGRHNRWQIGAIPLGGFVQMLDERQASVAPELLPYAFNRQAPWKKLLIALAGPAFNLLFAVIAYYLLGLYGINQLKPSILSLQPDSPLGHLSAFAPGSTIQAINGIPLGSWNEAEHIFLQQQQHTANLNFTLSQAGQTQIQTLNLAHEQGPLSLTELGIYPIKFLPQISYVEPQSAAATAGLRAGDWILAINQRVESSWFNIATTIKNSAGSKLQLRIQRGTQILNLEVIPSATKAETTEPVATPDSPEPDQPWPDSAGHGQIIGKLGIIPTLDADALKQNSFIQYYTLRTSFGYAVDSCRNLILTNLTMLWAILHGNQSWHNLGGPVTIAKAAHTALHQGLKSFVDLLALISIGLAVMNLLPIPVLDGGHILLYSIEWMLGKPLTLATQQLLMKIGGVIVIGISILALYNDLLKLLYL